MDVGWLLFPPGPGGLVRDWGCVGTCRPRLLSTWQNEGQRRLDHRESWDTLLGNEQRFLAFREQAQTVNTSFRN